MARNSAPAIGIDFGTSTTLVAQWAGAASRVVPIGEQRPWLDTIAGRSGDGWVYGLAAEGLPVTDVVRSVKRFITTPESRPASLSDGDVDQIIVGILQHVAGHGAVRELDPSRMGIRLGCPAQWEGEQRRRLARLAQAAGLDASVDDMVDEPIGAGIDWVMTRYENRREQPAGRVLVIDIGGGTLDVACLDVVFDTRPAIKVLACRGKEVAGDVVDDELADRLVDRLGSSVSAGRAEEPLLKQYLRRAARRLKVELSTTPEASLRLDDPYSDVGLVTLSQSDVNDALKPLLREIELQADLTLREAALRVQHVTVAEVRARSELDLRSEVAHVVLTGGMSQAPGVQAFVRELFTCDVDVVTGDEATSRIVRGFARQDAYDSLNLHRPGMNIWLRWSFAGKEHEELLFPAFSPVFDRYQILSGATPEFTNEVRAQVGGMVQGDVVIRTIGGTDIPFSYRDERHGSLKVMLSSWDPLKFALRMDGSILISESQTQATVLRLAEWPYVRMSGLGKQPAVEVIEVKGSRYGDGRDWGYWHK
jgi:actin-like ATPase involved in cell morphogenesis